MHSNYYDHDESEIDYKRFVHNIAYRFGFKVVEDDYVISKVEGDVCTKLVDGDKSSKNKIWYLAWMKLKEEYGYGGTE